MKQRPLTLEEYTALKKKRQEKRDKKESIKYEKQIARRTEHRALRLKRNDVIGSLASEMPTEYIVFDIETTGFDFGRQVDGKWINRLDRPTQAAYIHRKMGDDGFFHDIQQYNEYYSHNGNIDLGHEAKKVTKHTKYLLDNKGKPIKDEFRVFAEYIRDQSRKGVKIIAHNGLRFDVNAIESTYETLYGVPLNINRENVIDTMAIARAESAGEKRFPGESYKDYQNRVIPKTTHGIRNRAIDFAERHGVNMDDFIERYVKENANAALHDAHFDAKLISEAFEKILNKGMKHPEYIGIKKEIDEAIKVKAAQDAIFEEYMKMHEEALVENDKINFKKTRGSLRRSYIGYGFWAGAAVTGVAYALGRSPTDEISEKFGGKKDNPYKDFAIATGATVALNATLKYQGSFPNLIEMGKKALDPTNKKVSLKGQAFKLGGFGLLSYSGTALVHNMLMNDPGEGWRYPLISGTVGAAAVIGLAMYNQSDYDLNKVAKITTDFKDKALKDISDSSLFKGIKETGGNIYKGRIVPDPNHIINKAAVTTLGNKWSLGILGGSGILAAFTWMNQPENSESEQISIVNNINAGIPEFLSYNYINSTGSVKYRNSGRYLQNYKQEERSHYQPRGLGLV